MIRPCDICNEEKDGTTCAIYHPEPNQGIILTPLFMKGKHYFVCIECNMCYLAQYMEMTNKEITSWCYWINQDVMRQGQP